MEALNGIRKYFPALAPAQEALLQQLEPLYRSWNERINLISRKDIDRLYERHVLHSLAIARVVQPADGAEVLDAGTGGGFPGIPLAILFPQCRFTLADSIGKKVAAVREIAAALRLRNVQVVQARVETLTQNFDFVVSRAVADLPTFVGWVWGKVSPGCRGSLPNGILYLKGGDLDEELRRIPQKANVVAISDFFDEEFFETKKVVYIKRS
ncbi:MAG: 16S rRNA (guanine(527)-N(7))-methyltransferase RsmG [Prevotellaceae bacterium]|nr:16S rRNA (guanine(527)-N(7))-methyltransferase RsmG [Prevotellaceae bacterium]